MAGVVVQHCAAPKYRSIGFCMNRAEHCASPLLAGHWMPCCEFYHNGGVVFWRGRPLPPLTVAGTMAAGTSSLPRLAEHGNVRVRLYRMRRAKDWCSTCSLQQQVCDMPEYMSLLANHIDTYFALARSSFGRLWLQQRVPSVQKSQPPY